MHSKNRPNKATQFLQLLISLTYAQQKNGHRAIETGLGFRSVIFFERIFANAWAGAYSGLVKVKFIGSTLNRVDFKRSSADA